MASTFDSGSEELAVLRICCQKFKAARGTELRKKFAAKGHGGSVAAGLGLKTATV